MASSRGKREQLVFAGDEYGTVYIYAFPLNQRLNTKSSSPPTPRTIVTSTRSISLLSSSCLHSIRKLTPKSCIPAPVTHFSHAGGYLVVCQSLSSLAVKNRKAAPVSLEVYHVDSLTSSSEPWLFADKLVQATALGAFMEGLKEKEEKKVPQMETLVKHPSLCD